MVATRRGVRVSSPSKTTTELPTDVQATPSTGRRTRRTAKQEESHTQHDLVEACTQLEKCEGGHQVSPPPSSVRRCTRASRLHSPQQPSTPVGSIHDADVSDVESLCSVLSDNDAPRTRMRWKRQQPRAVCQDDEEVSEVESCSSALSASNTGRNTRQSTRKKTLPESSETARVDSLQEAESCGSVASESQRVTRSQRKSACVRSAAKQQNEDSEFSDTDSYLSSISGADIPKSTSRRATRSKRQTGPISIQLDESEESTHSPALIRRSSRVARGKIAGTVHVSEPQSCDSEGFESGPTYSIQIRRQGKAKPLDSDSEPTAVHSLIGSSSSKQSRGTPSASRRSVKNHSVTGEKCMESAEEDTSLNDSRLESTVVDEDADCTLLEEEKQREPESNGDASEEKGEARVSEEDSSVSRSVDKTAVTDRHQQEELCEENKEEATSEREKMQETASSELSKLCQSVTVVLCEKICETRGKTEDTVQVADMDASHRSEDEDAVEETQPTVEKMEAKPLNSDGQQVVASIQVNSSQKSNITVASSPEQRPEVINVQNKKAVSLLESSEDEEEGDEDEMEVSDMAEELEGPSNRCEGAGTSVDSLFMIDTRPGQEVDEHYYVEKTTKEERAEQEDEDEFVDEEGDDDDEDADILFSSRNPLLKEMSSRIDPGIRVKELGGLYINFDGSKSKPVSSSLPKLKEKKIQDEVMKKSVIGPEFEKKDAVPPYSESKRASKLKHRVEREKTTGDGWFNMKAPEITQELKGDLQVLKMRGSLDPKRFYKKNDRDGFPKYFQVGTVVDTPVDFYHSRIPKKGRKRTVVEELLADAEFRHQNKKRFQKIMVEKAAQGAGRRNRKKNKFHKKMNAKK